MVSSAVRNFFLVRTIPLKLIFYLQGVIRGTIGMSLVVFLTTMGLNVSEAGFITGMHVLSSVIASPIWGFVVDRTGRRKLVFVIMCVGSAITVFSMPFIGAVLMTNEDDQHSYAKKYNLSMHSNFHGGTTVINNSSPIQSRHDHGINEIEGVVIDEKRNHQSFGGNLFYAMLAMLCVSNIFLNPVIGIIDSFIMKVVAASEGVINYGHQRLFWDVGLATGSVMAGYCTDKYNNPALPRYTAVFYVFLPASLLMLPVGLILISQLNAEEQNGECQLKKSSPKHVILILRKFENVVFILNTLVAGIANGIFHSYLFLLMREEMLASNTQMGLITFTLGMLDIIVYLFSEEIMDYIGGPIAAFEIAVLAFVPAYIIISYLVNPWFVLLTQLLLCVSFALFFVGGAQYTHSITSDEIYVTLFSIVNSVYFDVGAMTANFIGELVYSQYGGRILFRADGYLCGIWFIFTVCYYHLFHYIRNLFEGYANVSGE